MNLQGIKNRIRKVLAYTITAVIFLFVSAFLVLQIPPVQNLLVKSYLGSFSEVTGFKSEIKTFRMLWFDRLELDDVSIYDPDNNKMIGVKKLLINFKLSHLFKHTDINIDGVFVDGAEVFLTDVNASDTSRYLNINVWIDRIAQQFSSDTTSSGRAPALKIGEAYVNQSVFKYADQDEDSIRNGFDYYHFTLHVDEGQLERFVVLGDTTEFDLNTLIIEDEKTKFKVDQLSTFFRICKTSMEYRGLDLHAGKSLIRDTVIFSYQGFDDFKNFNEKVNIHGNLTKSVVDPYDLALFAPGVEQLKQLIKVSGIADGRVNKFKVKDMDIAMGNTRLQGAVDMDGLPDLNETFININLKNSNVLFTDLSFILNDEVLEQLKPLGRLSLNGQFLGYPTDFVANGKFNSKLGQITSDMNFKVDEGKFDHSIYSGQLALYDFQLGTYLNDTVTFQNINMNGRMKGSGLSKATADFTLDGSINSIGVLGYNYANINTNGRFSSEFFSGMLNINDPNLKLKAQGSIDLRENKNIVKVQAVLDTAILHNLKLVKDKISLHAGMDINISGFQIDSLVGTANFTDFLIRYDEEELGLKNIHLRSEKSGKERSINLETTLVDAQVKGNFLFSDLAVDVRTLIKEVLLNVKNDKEATKVYYESKSRQTNDYETVFNVKLKDISGITNLIDVELQLSPNVAVDGKFTSGKTTILQIFSTIDSLQYNGSQFVHNDVELTASKISDSTSVLAMFYVNSEKQFYGPNVQTENLLMEGIWNKSHIDFSLDADQQSRNNSMRLKGGIDFLPDSTLIQLHPSAIKVLASHWSFDPNNLIVLSNDEWFFKNVTLKEAGQSVGLSGYLSKDPKKNILLEVDNLNLAILDVITGLKFTGTLDARTELSNYANAPALQNDIFIDSLTINKFLIGDITGKNLWVAQEKRFDINFFIDRLKNRIVNLNGYYNPSDEISPLNVTAKLEKADVNIIEPFLDEIFSRWGGTATGSYQIRGKLNEPEIEGEAEVVNGQMMVNYLKTQYRFHGKVAIKKNSIHFKQFELIDGFKNKGTVEGAIVHRNYTDFKITLDANFRNLQVLNTSAKDNELFYGQAYATGTVNFSGPFSNLKISGQAKSQKNTRIYIPINTSSSVNKKEFINFVNLSDTVFLKKFKKSINNKIRLSNLSFDMNLDITPDAYCEIILDIKAGDIIRGRGNGELQLQLDTKGDFNMFGFFEFTQGWYNFTLYDIINKEFEIQAGSRISWFGDPYAGNLNINASYNQMAMFGPVVQNTELSTAPQLRRKYPALVLLKLDGPMLSPAINFDILAKDLPKNIMVDVPQSTQQTPVNLDFDFKAFRSKLDEQELKRQVFSLIVLKRFSPPDQFNTQGSLANSVSELFSNQLSNWMTQVDENLEIDVDLGSFDQEAFNTFQLRLSYTFLNGRLRITRDGTFNNNSPNNSNNNNSSSVSNIAGDWTVDYLLTADGKFKVKMYNRTNVNPILNTIGTQNTFTTGVSVLYTQSFNEIKDLLRSARSKRRKEQEKAAALNKEATKEENDGTD
jgi:hypothetical protein